MAGAEVRVLVVGDQEGRDNVDGMEVVTTRPLNVYRDWLAANPPFKKLVWHVLENFNPRAFFRMRRELKAHKSDLLLTISVENINVASWLAARTLRVPIVHFAQSYFLMCWRGQLFRNGSNCSQCVSCKVLSVGKKLMARYVDGLMTETGFLARIHTEAGYFSEARIRVVPAAIESANVTLKSKSPGLRVGYLGTHTRNKGIETLADAACRLKHNAAIQFIVGGVGDENYMAELRHTFPPASTTFVGWVKPGDFYSKVDVVVVPSVWREPFGRVSIEGTAFGVPALVARSGGLPENVEDGVDGFIFEPRDAAGLAALLERLANDPNLYAAVSAAARKRAMRYTSERLGHETLAFLQEIKQASHHS